MNDQPEPAPPAKPWPAPRNQITGFSVHCLDHDAPPWRSLVPRFLQRYDDGAPAWWLRIPAPLRRQLRPAPATQIGWFKCGDDTASTAAQEAIDTQMRHGFDFPRHRVTIRPSGITVMVPPDRPAPAAAETPGGDS